MPHCWVGFFDDNLLKEIVRVPQEKVIEAIIVLGIESKTKLKNEEKTKPELENIVFFEKWGNEKKEPHIIVHRD